MSRASEPDLTVSVTSLLKLGESRELISSVVMELVSQVQTALWFHSLRLLFLVKSE